MKREMAVHHCKGLALEGGKVVGTMELRDVEVMARVRGYAMVRRKGCVPYVVWEKALHPAALGSGRQSFKRFLQDRAIEDRCGPRA
jgi:hypothetical protein